MLSFFPRGVLDEILNLIESVSEGFPSYSYLKQLMLCVLQTNAVLLDGLSVGTITYLLLIPASSATTWGLSETNLRVDIVTLKIDIRLITKDAIDLFHLVSCQLQPPPL